MPGKMKTIPMKCCDKATSILADHLHVKVDTLVSILDREGASSLPCGLSSIKVIDFDRFVSEKEKPTPSKSMDIVIGLGKHTKKCCCVGYNIHVLLVECKFKCTTKTKALGKNTSDKISPSKKYFVNYEAPVCVFLYSDEVMQSKGNQIRNEISRRVSKKEKIRVMTISEFVKEYIL